MLPIDFEGSNTVFGPPKNWNEKIQGACIPVPALTEKDQNNPGGFYVCTMWQPSEKDKEAIAAGCPIILQCYGGMPPVCLYTINKDGTSNAESLVKMPDTI